MERVFERFNFSKEDFESYLDERYEYSNDGVLSRNAKYKFEYGLEYSQSYFANKYEKEVLDFSQNHNINFKRAVAYFKYLLFATPCYGKRGFECLKEYTKLNDIPYKKEEVLASAIEYDEDEKSGFVPYGFREILLNLFNINEDSISEEVAVAKMFYLKVELIKLHSLNSLKEGEEMGEVWTNIIDEYYRSYGLEECINALYEEISASKLDYPKINEEQKQKYYDAIKSYDYYDNEHNLEGFITHEVDLKI